MAKIPNEKAEVTRAEKISCYYAAPAVYYEISVEHMGEENLCIQE